jgi:acylphosphatase
MIVARRLTISGRVQRVGFRWFAIEAAGREGVTGWVQNLPDGRVEVLVEGEAEAVDRFERAVRRGPSSSRVDEVETDILAPTGRFHGFSSRG